MLFPDFEGFMVVVQGNVLSIGNMCAKVFGGNEASGQQHTHKLFRKKVFVLYSAFPVNLRLLPINEKRE